MDLDTWLLMGTVALMVANRAVHIGERWYERKAVFWGIQLSNFLVACALVTFGIPGFQGPLRIVNLLLAGLLILHTVQNNRRYLVAWRGVGAGPDDDEREARRAEVLERLSND